MDTLEFIASIIDSLAWPLAIVVLIFILRMPLGKLIPFLERLKFKGLELDFTKRVHVKWQRKLLRFCPNQCRKSHTQLRRN